MTTTPRPAGAARVARPARPARPAGPAGFAVRPARVAGRVAGVVAAGVLLAGVLVLAACGVPTGVGVEVASDDDVPFGLLDENHRSVIGGPTDGDQLVLVYLVDSSRQRLVPAVRPTDDESVRSVLAELERDVSEIEATLGLRSALADRDVIERVRIDDDVATIDLSPSFTDISSPDQLLAVGQLVLTTTSRPEVESVRFVIDGADVEVPRGDGSLTRTALTAADFETLLAPS